jgi:transcriptional regulator with PAS, ATPase and Fis domain
MTANVFSSALAPLGPACLQTPELVGQSSAMSSVREIAASVAHRRSTVLILGETGSGKELLARHIHGRSDRRDRAFVPVDCSAMTDTLFESQLFGHVRGAFTGAVRDSLGFIRSAEGGTLFIDEVGELALPLQAKLLRVIEERSVVPVGDARPRAVDIRIIAATHRDLAELVRTGEFREDLYFRLNVVVLTIPPLRQRPGDILLLAEHFLAVQADLYGEKTRRLSPQAIEVLQHYAWPGNVRELANVIEHAHVLATGDTILPEDFPERIRCGASDLGEPTNDLLLSNLERRAIAEALRRCRYRKAPAARMLGINVQRLRRLMSRLNVREPSRL